MSHQDPREVAQLFNEIRQNLATRYGELIGVRDLWLVMGFPSQEALQRAYARGTIGLPIFEIEHRRGRFALTTEVASWLVKSRQAATSNEGIE